MRRHIRWIAVFKAVRCIGAAAVVATGCAPHTQPSSPLAGNYPRASVRFIEGSHDLPVPTEGPLADRFPTLLMLDNRQSFAAESDAGRISGKYRVEADSLIFDQYKGGTHWPVYTGHLFGDTIVVRWLTAAGDEPVPTSTAVQFAFVLKKTRQTRSGI